MANNYEVGTAAWQPDPTEGWVASEVKEKNVDGDKVTLIFLLENGEVCYSQLVLPGEGSSWAFEYALTQTWIDEISCDNSSGVTRAKQSVVAAVDESGDARGERRSHQFITFE